MITADTPAGRVIARAASRDDGPFLCPACSSPVIIKKGEVVTHHFAHARDADCDYGVGETELHRRAKEAVYDGLHAHPLVKGVQLEVAVAGNRADVLFESGSGVLVAVEIQRSNLGECELELRTEKYSAGNVAVCWVVAEVSPLLARGATVRTRRWHRWIHDMMGTVYVWLDGAMATPVAFKLVPAALGGGWLETKKRCVAGTPIHIAELGRGTLDGMWGGRDAPRKPLSLWERLRLAKELPAQGTLL